MNRYQIYLENLSLSSSISGRIPVNRRSRADHPIAVRSPERCEGVNPLTPASQGPIAKSGFGVCGGKRSLPFEIANSDFPIQSGPLIDRRDTWHRTSGFRGSALGNSRRKGLMTKESRFPELIRAVDRQKDTWRKIPVSRGLEALGFPGV
jgi:hypothetical protein